MIVLGIDPGAVSGAYAALHEDGTGWPDDLPVVNGQVDAATLDGIIHDYTEIGDVVAVVEAVSSMPGQGVASTFKFGVAYGIIRGVLAANGVPIIFVAPSKWKGHFRLKGGKDKEPSRALAIQRFPGMASQLKRKRDQNRAEALLIAQYYVETGRHP